MAIVNLRKHYYPLYTKDTFVEVPDEVAAVMEECRLYENRQEGKKSYYHVFSVGYWPCRKVTDAKRVSLSGGGAGVWGRSPHRVRRTQQPPAGRTTPATVYKCALGLTHSHRPRFFAPRPTPPMLPADGRGQLGTP